MAEKGTSHRAVRSRRAVIPTVGIANGKDKQSLPPGAPSTSPSTVTVICKDKQNFTYKTDAGSTLYGFRIRCGSSALLMDPISAIASTDWFKYK